MSFIFLIGKLLSETEMQWEKDDEDKTQYLHASVQHDVSMWVWVWWFFDDEYLCLMAAETKINDY